ncbi:MAG TPA: hypothetical protein VHX86_04230 [Tepidisphaeraceae bacterium]|jgi:hypothetical protein|nr:hypothetical protein [Tepidisphaeraceae bacterium]
MRKRWKAVVLAGGSVTTINGVGRAQPVFLNTTSTAGTGARRQRADGRCTGTGQGGACNPNGAGDA